MAKTQTAEDAKLYNASLEILRLRSKLSDLFYNLAHTKNYNNPETKISILKTIEQNEYKPLLRQLAYKKSPSELLLLSGVLDDLATITHEIGKLTQILEATPKEEEIPPKDTSHTTNITKPITTPTSLKYYTDAAILHQYVISILSGDKTTDYSKISIEAQYKKLDQIKTNIFSSISCSSNIKSITKIISIKNTFAESEAHKQYLKDLREESKCRVKEIEKNKSEEMDDLYVTTSKSLFQDIATRMKSFLSTLYQESEQELNQLLQIVEPPCTYSVIGLGSLALKQATPYSDLEFAILTENEDYKSNPDLRIQNYFKNLTHLVHFKVINLGETIIPKSQYKDKKYGDLDLSHLIHQGVNFDLGGKTPLGRIDGDKPYNLIKTVEWMMYYVRNENDKATHIDKALAYILENACHVHGNKALTDQYRSAVTTFMHESADVQVGAEVAKQKTAEILQEKVDQQQQPTQDVQVVQGILVLHIASLQQPINQSTQTDILYQQLTYHKRTQHELRAIKVLKEGATEFEYAPGRLLEAQPRQHHFVGDIAKLQPNLSDAEGRFFDVKKEIYRLPDRMIYNLGMLFGVQGESGWEIVDKLATSQEAAGNQLMRPQIINERAAKNLKYAVSFATTLRLKTYLNNAAQSEDMSLFGSEKVVHLKSYITQPTPVDNGAAMPLAHNTSQTQETIQAIRVFHLEEADLKEDGGLFRYFYVALELHKKVEEFCIDKNRVVLHNFFEQCSIYNDNDANKGMIYYRLMQYQYAQLALQKALESPGINSIIHTLQIKHILSTLYCYSGNIPQAMQELEQIKSLASSVETIAHAKYALYAHIGLGVCYLKTKDYDSAELKHMEALKAVEVLCIRYPHFLLTKAHILHNLGNVYFAWSIAALQNSQMLDSALKCFDKSIEIKQDIYKTDINIELIRSFVCKGNVYATKKEYKIALLWYQKAREIMQGFCHGEPHPNLAGILYSMGNILVNNENTHSRDLFLALDYLLQSFDMRKVLYGELHPDVAASIGSITALCTNIYESSKNQADYEQALRYGYQSIEICNKILSINLYAGVIETLKNSILALVTVYMTSHDTKAAISCCNEYLEYYSSKLDNPLLQETTSIIFACLGDIYYNTQPQQFDMATEKYLRAVKVGANNHRDLPGKLADALQNTVVINVGQGHEIEAIKHCIQVYKCIKNNDITAILVHAVRKFSEKNELECQLTMDVIRCLSIDHNYDFSDHKVVFQFGVTRKPQNYESLVETRNIYKLANILCPSTEVMDHERVKIYIKKLDDLLTSNDISTKSSAEYTALYDTFKLEADRTFLSTTTSGPSTAAALMISAVNTAGQSQESDDVVSAALTTPLLGHNVDVSSSHD